MIPNASNFDNEPSAKDKGSNFFCWAATLLKNVGTCTNLDGTHALIGVEIMHTLLLLTLPKIYLHPWFKLSQLVKNSNEDSNTNKPLDHWWYGQQVTAVVERLIGISPSMELIKVHREMILLLLVLAQVTSDH